MKGLTHISKMSIIEYNYSMKRKQKSCIFADDYENGDRAVLGTGVIANETAAALKKNGKNIYAVGNQTYEKAVVAVVKNFLSEGVL